MTTLTRRLLLCAFVLIAMLIAPPVIPSLYAELPPGSYEKLKADAQEKLKIRITEVHQKEKGRRKLEVTLKAEVLDVERSNSLLKPGDTIIIHSYRWIGRYAGPKNPPPLPVGWVGMAYLNKLEYSSKDADDHYTLAAYGESFE